MGWKDNLRPASFRGVPFQVESGDLSVGRRVQTHEYPGRDKPYTEDLGRATRKTTIEAFLVGDDYMAQRDRLLAALEAGGPGELIHPWHGRMMVCVDGECRVRHASREGRFCAITLSMVESGELAFPAATASTAAQAWSAVDLLKMRSIEAFAARFSLTGMTEYGVSAAVLDANAAFGKLDAALLQYSVVMKNPTGILLQKTGLGSLLASAETFGQLVHGLFNSGSGFAGGNAGVVLFTLELATQFTPTSSGTSTSQSARITENSIALNALMRQAVIVQAAGMSVGIAIDVYDDGAALLAGLATVIEAEMYDADDAIYAALQDVRIKCHADIARRLRDAARLREITPREVVPALVLAYDLYEDPQRGEEIVSRNKLRHPGFVPATPIKVAV